MHTRTPFNMVGYRIGRGWKNAEHTREKNDIKIDQV